MSKKYVLLDAMGIQPYIFQTNTLKVILGASLALARWQKDCEKICSNLKGNLIASAGGNVLASFENDNAKSFRKKCIQERPLGMDIAWAETQEAETDDKTWKILQQEIARFKAGDRDAVDYDDEEITGVPGCLHCGIQPLDKKGKVGNRRSCCICRKLHTLGEELHDNAGKGGTTSIEKLYDIPLKQGLSETFPTALDKMVERPDGKGNDFLAVVVIDLNGIGNRIKEIVGKNDFQQLKSFSFDLEADFYNVFSGAVTEIGKNADGFSQQGQFIRLRPLLLGGDDAIFAMPAPFWPDFVDQSLKDLDVKGYPASAGVAVSKHNYPINRLVRMAEELVSSAKGLVRYIAEEKSAIDWHTHQESAFTDPMEIRKRNYLIPPDAENRHYAVCTRRPYLLSEFQNFRQQAKLLREPQQSDKKSISNRKLYALYQALRRGPVETRNTLTYVFLRDEDDLFRRYRTLWDQIWSDDASKDQNGYADYPLWQIVKEDEEIVLTQDGPVYYTSWTDILELKWALEKPDEKEEV